MVITLYYENHKKPINIVYGQNKYLLKIQLPLCFKVLQAFQSPKILDLNINIVHIKVLSFTKYMNSEV
jgi:hypothetical protein